jgi:hypothetical protein
LVEVISSLMQLVMERKFKRVSTNEAVPTGSFPIDENHRAADGNHFAIVAFTIREEEGAVAA